MTSGPRRELTLIDAVGLMVGIIIGVGIFQVAPDVARGTSGAGTFLALWLAGGLISLFGALGYAELASAYPEAGGDYVYLTRAYGPWAGFLFGWLQLAIVRPGDIAAMAFAFATYAAPVADAWLGVETPARPNVWAAAAVIALTAINILGARSGKRAQNALAALKVAGLIAVIALAFAAPRPLKAPAPMDPLPGSLALILVLFTYGGWTEMAYVAAELKNPGRNALRAMILGMTVVTALYMAANAGFLAAMGGHMGLQASKAVAVDAVSGALPGAATWIAALICVSALGAVNGLIFTGSRIAYATGADHALFRRLGVWNGKSGAPSSALAVQGAVSVALIFVMGSFTDTLLYTAAPVYLFHLATSLSIGVLRRRDPERPRPTRVWGYPATTGLFCAVCAWLVYRAVLYRPAIALAALAILLLGLPLYALSRSMGRTP